MKTKLIILSILVLCLSTAPAFAAPGGPPGGALQGVLNDITSPYPGTSSVDVTTDFVPDNLDTYWDITATGGSVSTVIIELAGFAENNLFGVYDSADHTNFVQIFGGAAVAGDQALLSITSAGDVYLNFGDTGVDFAGDEFGYYLDSSFYGGGGNFYSDTSLNTDGPGGAGYDHMYAYQGKGDTVKIDIWDEGTWTNNEYVVAFEDLYGGVDGSGADWDYTDFVVMVESVHPIPVPGAVLLGILGLSAAGIKLRRFA